MVLQVVSLRDVLWGTPLLNQYINYTSVCLPCQVRAFADDLSLYMKIYSCSTDNLIHNVLTFQNNKKFIFAHPHLGD